MILKKNVFYSITGNALHLILFTDKVESNVPTNISEATLIFLGTTVQVRPLLSHTCNTAYYRCVGSPPVFDW